MVNATPALAGLSAATGRDHAVAVDEAVAITDLDRAPACHADDMGVEYFGKVMRDLQGASVGLAKFKLRHERCARHCGLANFVIKSKLLTVASGMTQVRKLRNVTR